jgi:hypothetical protein
MAREKSLARELRRFFFHGAMAAFASTILGLVLAVFLGGAAISVFGVRSLVWRRLLNDVPYSPFLWGSGLLLGFLINRSMRDRSACWLGLFGARALVSVMAWDVSFLSRSEYYRRTTGGHFWNYEVGQLFALNSNVCGNSECLDELFFTTPLFNLVSYSVGAYLGLRSKRDAAIGDGSI